MSPSALARAANLPALGAYLRGRSVPETRLAAGRLRRVAQMVGFRGAMVEDAAPPAGPRWPRSRTPWLD